MPLTLRRLLSSLVILACAAPLARAAEPPKVLASIKPLHALAAGVMDGIGQPSLLLRATASAHTYSLRPSDARAVAHADVVFWIGPSYETFMAKAVGERARKARVVAMAPLGTVRLLPTRSGGVWDGGADHSHAHGHNHGTAEMDMHLWLDPANAKAIAAAMAEALAASDPSHQAAYRANAARLTDELDRLDARLRARLAPVASKPFVVFHDAYQYFERRYGLAAAGSITVTPDRVPGPRRLSDLRRAIVERQAACVFGEPQFTSGLVSTLLEGTSARAGVLDAIGVATPEGKDGYGVLLGNLADSLTGCLGQAS